MKNPLQRLAVLTAFALSTATIYALANVGYSGFDECVGARVLFDFSLDYFSSSSQSPPFLCASLSCAIAIISFVWCNTFHQHKYSFVFRFGRYLVQIKLTRK